MKDDFYVPADADISLQSTDNKQGRSEEIVDQAIIDQVKTSLEQGQKQSYDEYTQLIDDGIARELARINLPLSLYTEWYWQIDLHNLFHFLALRLDAHAQKEIRVYAEVMLDIAKKVAPRCCESFERNIKGGVRFTQDELIELKRRLNHDDEESLLKGKDLERFEEKLKSGRQK
jgi:thymidylate synthase (FAD)